MLTRKPQCAYGFYGFTSTNGGFYVKKSKPASYMRRTTQGMDAEERLFREKDGFHDGRFSWVDLRIFAGQDNAKAGHDAPHLDCDKRAASPG